MNMHGTTLLRTVVLHVALSVDGDLWRVIQMKSLTQPAPIHPVL